MSSTHMNITMALRRISTPTAPIANRIAESDQVVRRSLGLLLARSLDLGLAFDWPARRGARWPIGRLGALTVQVLVRPPSCRAMYRVDRQLGDTVPSGSSAGMSTALCRA